jgi:hypothetical protein
VSFGPDLNPAQRRGRLTASIGAALLICCAGCPQEPPAGPDIIFPADYRTTFTEVRDCRNSVEHAATIRVWVNAIGAEAYFADENPLPVGTIVVKEEFAGGGCDDDADLAIWSVMRKEAAGFDPDANDWRFQEVSSPGRTITLDDKATCIACHDEPECVARDFMCTAP